MRGDFGEFITAHLSDCDAVLRGSFAQRRDPGCLFLGEGQEGHAHPAKRDTQSRGNVFPPRTRGTNQLRLKAAWRKRPAAISDTAVGAGRLLADVVSPLNDRNVHVKMGEGHSNRRTNDTRPHDQDIWSLHKWEAA